MGIASSVDSSPNQTTDHTNDNTWWGMYVLLPLVGKAVHKVVGIQGTRMVSPGYAQYTVDAFLRVCGCVG